MSFKIYKENVQRLGKEHRNILGEDNNNDVTLSLSTMDGVGDRGTTYSHRRRRASNARRNSNPTNRLVLRNLPFGQSHNHLQVRNQHFDVAIWNLLVHDWFHVLLRFPLLYSVTSLLLLWTAFILIFAGFYMALDRNNPAENCGLGAPGYPITFGPAFAFSLETCTTVGYGLPGDTNAFFEARCSAVQLVIYLQMVWSMMFNAFLFAFFFARIAKSESRGVQVIFTKEAIVNYVNHKEDVGSQFPCFQIRVFDVDSRYPVVEAHVRLYAIMKNSSVPQPLRIAKPNDDLGAMLFTSVPNDIVHVMDAYSILTPNQLEHQKIPLISADEDQQEIPHVLTDTVGTGNGLVLRQIDSLTGGRDDCVCPICGESYGTIDRLIRHGQYTAIQEEEGDIPIPNSHQEIDWKVWKDKLTHQWSLNDLRDYFVEQVSEIICVVEGIDPLNGGSFQALQSYQISDIEFRNVQFADCISVDKKKDKKIVVDMEAFHRVVPSTALVDDDKHNNNETYQASSSADTNDRNTTTSTNGHNNNNNNNNRGINNAEIKRNSSKSVVIHDESLNIDVSVV